MSSRYLIAGLLGVLVGLCISFVCGQCSFWLWSGWSIPAAQTQQMSEVLELQMVASFLRTLHLGVQHANYWFALPIFVSLGVAWLSKSERWDRFDRILMRGMRLTLMGALLVFVVSFCIGACRGLIHGTVMLSLLCGLELGLGTICICMLSGLMPGAALIIAFNDEMNRGAEHVTLIGVLKQRWAQCRR